MIYEKYNYINKFYNFNIKLNYGFKTWKNQASITLVMVCVIVIAPIMHVHGKDFYWMAFVLDLILVTLKVKNGILNIIG
jgi:hypothetical protein